MAPECDPCAYLRLEELLALADKEYDAEFFPGKAYYQHHSSFAHLEQAADDGCDLCRLIVDCFKGAPRGENTHLWPPEWEPHPVEATMYHIAKRLGVSDVKLALGSSAATTNRRREASVFDVMMVQIGKRWDYWGMHKDRLPPLRLTLTAPRDCTANKVKGFQIGRNQLDPDLASDDNHGIARSWLEECRSTHKGCKPSGLPELPTRVVDVGKSNLDAARIIHSDGLAAEYIALSHCWGGHIATALTSKTASQFQHALPQNELPANFRDSITIARQLRIRYLWIDSLCILQDSAHDWAQESQNMASVYGNATLTLSAIAASSSSVGLLSNHPIPTPKTPPITIRIRSSDPTGHRILVQHGDPNEESLRSLTDDAPLSRRGWTLQESVLSRRTLFYGARQLYWSCPEVYHAADGLCQLDKAPKTWLPDISNLLHTSIAPNPEKVGNLLEEYYSLVAKYSSRTLTCPSDKFPALAGLAQRLQPALKTEYIAGLWLSDIHRGLLWAPRTHSAPHVVPARAPSWSWAVTDERISFKFVNPCDSGWAAGGSGAMMEVKGWEVVLSEAGDIFGQVVSGRLVVETRLMELVRSEQGGHFGYKGGKIYYDEWFGGMRRALRDLVVMEGFVLSVAVRGDVKKGAVFESDPEAEIETGYFLMLVHADEEGVKIRGRQASTKCLVVRRVQGKDMEFERVGVAVVYNTKTAWLDCWEKCVLTLV